MSLHTPDAGPGWPPDVAAAIPVFAALGDETRVGLVLRLSADGPLSISRLTDGVAVTRQAVTKHLHVLADAGLARHARLGRETVWELTPGPFDRARACLDRLSAEWDGALDRLKLFVESGGSRYNRPRPALKGTRKRGGRKE
jgi:DNA-binding transcriptional ArsR family regulator